MTNCPDHHHQSFHPTSLLSRKLGDAVEDAGEDVEVEDQRNPSIHLSKNLGDVAEDIEDKEEEVFLQAG